METTKEPSSNSLDPYLFKPFATDDMPLLFSWMQRPHVAAWWKSGAYNEFIEKYSPQALAQNHTVPFLMIFEGTPIGYIQYYHADQTDGGWWSHQHPMPPGTVGMDILIGEPDFLHRGLGSIFIRKFIAKMFVDAIAPKIIIDPDASNLPAIRCYEKLGFRRLKEVVAPAFLDGPSGKLLLMELTQEQHEISPGRQFQPSI